MSTVNGGWRGPNIVKNGLVLYLDAGSPNSYNINIPSTTWKDISGDGNRAILTNGALYNNANEGNILFDGVNDSIRFFNDALNSFTVGNKPSISPTSQFTIEQVFRPTFIRTDNFFGLRNQLLRKGQGASTLNYYTQIDSDNIFQFFTRNSSESLKSVSFTVPSMLNNISIVSIVVNNFSISCYFNGQFISTQTINTTLIESNINDTMGIGDLGVTATYFSGNYYSCKLYNRALTEQEVVQNYNATKSRFGL
jgi:hypothetical protein